MQNEKSRCFSIEDDFWLWSSFGSGCAVPDWKNGEFPSFDLVEERVELMGVRDWSITSNIIL